MSNELKCSFENVIDLDWTIDSVNPLLGSIGGGNGVGTCITACCCGDGDGYWSLYR